MAITANTTRDKSDQNQNGMCWPRSQSIEDRQIRNYEKRDQEENSQFTDQEWTSNEEHYFGSNGKQQSAVKKNNHPSLLRQNEVIKKILIK